ncbi:hypothetical protein [Variovorax sp. JS1663]|uniref:hypothetical protein n=1 Tax=Variovorax sp. JS1663 TaxID=1851577 RepID=UPI000B34515C|nr:hypothetical protein [Variovorax sp. JS1663]OUL99190.1 hypothetical protein A8M77_27710 [Variovorax sp. JS1663]
MLIGPLAPDEVTAQRQQAIGDWKAPERRRGWVFAYPSDLDRLAPPAPISVPDKANANYVARIPLAMNAEAPDFPALFAGVQLLGGRAGAAPEVGFARRAIVSGRADALAQPANLAGTLATNLRHGRDMAHYARFTQAYETLDADAVNAALKKYLRPERQLPVRAWGSFAQASIAFSSRCTSTFSGPARHTA